MSCPALFFFTRKEGRKGLSKRKEKKKEGNTRSQSPRIVLYDIRVHTLHKGKGGVYTNPTDYHQLAPPCYLYRCTTYAHSTLEEISNMSFLRSIAPERGRVRVRRGGAGRFCNGRRGARAGGPLGVVAVSTLSPREVRATDNNVTHSVFGPFLFV